MFKENYNRYLKIVNNSLLEIFDSYKRYPEVLYESMEYSLFSGGKRIRPVILLAVHELLGGNLEESIPLALGIELIHTYSLIHDDLPSMDNDEYRRGKLTNHIKFGENVAILAGDGLLNYAYEFMLSNSLRYPKKIENHINAIYLIAKSAGIDGMISGQVVDIKNQDRLIDDETLKYIHDNKTGKLLLAPIHAAIALEEPEEDKREALLKYGENLGLAFQIIDDILDVTGDFKNLGKIIGSDKDELKSTYVSKHGVEGSHKIAIDLYDEAICSLDVFSDESEFLKKLFKFTLERNY